MKNVNVFACLLLLLVFACKNNDEEDNAKYQKDRNNIVNVQIKDIKVDFPLGAAVVLITNDDFVFLTDFTANTYKGTHLFNKNTLKYRLSTVILGKGSGEIARQGRIGVDPKNRIFWVQDYGKKLMWKFHLDSVLKNEMYMPTEKIEIYDKLFLVDNFEFLNDSIALGIAAQITSNSSFVMDMAKLNINTNETELYGYHHPKAVEKKSYSKNKVSKANNLYVTCYKHLDLMTICNLDGTLKYNIYGPDWMRNKDNSKSYFHDVEIFKDNIIVAYSGDVRMVYDKFKRVKVNLQSKFLIFDLDGNYKQTIETGYKFSAFCLDEENSRIIIYFEDRENPLGYINLNLD